MNGTFNISRDERFDTRARNTESHFRDFLEGKNLSTLREKYIVTTMKMTTVYNPSNTFIDTDKILLNTYLTFNQCTVNKLLPGKLYI